MTARFLISMLDYIEVVERSPVDRNPPHISYSAVNGFWPVELADGPNGCDEVVRGGSSVWQGQLYLRRRRGIDQTWSCRCISDSLLACRLKIPPAKNHALHYMLPSSAYFPVFVCSHPAVLFTGTLVVMIRRLRSLMTSALGLLTSPWSDRENAIIGRGSERSSVIIPTIHGTSFLNSL
jgi:hypothetical protein